ncbi:delta-60 repeat domain-containing protein [Herbidospora mongoliensis]|uniref:delta-60 repeat domain-containing protein n=1 Tax=Herbidospora mongoliensis TaxID=688067 RepID=UPI00082FB005|nr:delta-60 repeat domain-containing protein [Herbidospora mongoliensis]
MRARFMITVSALALVATPASAGVRHPSVVSANPVNHTPHVLDGIVNALALVGGTVVVGGEFSSVRSGTATYRRTNLFAFDLTTGRVSPFAPYLDGPVNALATGTNGTVYAGGSFSRGIAAVSVPSGAAVPSFGATAYGGEITSLVRQGAHLYVGGDFSHIGRAQRTALARLDANTGAVDPTFTVSPGGGRSDADPKVHAMAATKDRLILDGSFTTLDGRPRDQLGQIDLKTGKVAAWRTDAYAPHCRDGFPSYVRGLDVSPDGTYFVVVTTGGASPKTGKLCDTAARFETYAKGANVKPTWVNHTGGDSLYSVAITGKAVYVGGHQRWMDNPLGKDSAGRGAVPREGIAAIHPRTGMALGWNPGRERGIGVKAFLAVKKGLLVGSDTTNLGHEYHARVGMFPMP